MKIDTRVKIIHGNKDVSFIIKWKDKKVFGCVVLEVKNGNITIDRGDTPKKYLKLILYKFIDELIDEVNKI